MRCVSGVGLTRPLAVVRRGAAAAVKTLRLAALISLPLALSLTLASCSEPGAERPDLEVRDLYRKGDGLITYDPATGLEWLDVAMSRGLSMDEVRGDLDPNSPLIGWRLATLDQFVTLFGHAVQDIAPQLTGTYIIHFQPRRLSTRRLVEFVRLLNITPVRQSNRWTALGFLNPNPPRNADGSYVMVRITFLGLAPPDRNTVSYVEITDSFGSSITSHRRYGGFFLVRRADGGG